MEKIGPVCCSGATVVLCGDAARTRTLRCRRSERQLRPSWRRTRTQSTSIPSCFSACRTVYNERQSLKLDPESLRLVEIDYDQFVHAGANLSDADKAQLKKLNEELATLSNDVQQQAAGGDQGARLCDNRQSRAGRLERRADRRRRRSSEGPQSRRLRHSVAEHDAAARPGVPEQSRRRAQALFDELVEPRRTRRRQRHARHDRTHRAAAGAEGRSCWAIPTSLPGSWKTRWPRRRKLL